QATYLGSIFIDSAAGQVTCHVSYGQSRKWGVWNAYNREPISMKAGDGTASWNYNTSTIRAANGNSANSLTIFCGLPEEKVFATAIQKAQGSGNFTSNSGSYTAQATNLIGFNSTTVGTGTQG